MHMLGGDERAFQGAIASGVDGDFGVPRQLAHDAGVFGGQLQRHVSSDGGDTQNLDLFGAGKRQKNGDGVVLSGIGVDYDLAGHGGLRGR